MARERPVVVLVIAIVNMVMGGLGVLCGLCGAGTNLFLFHGFKGTGAGAPGSEINEMMQFVSRQVPAYEAVEVGKPVLVLLLAVVLVVAGIGLLGMHSWARWLSLGYAACTLLLHFGYVCYELGLVLPAIDRWLRQQPVFVGGNNPGSAIGIVGGAMLFIAHAVALAVILLLPVVSRAFAANPVEPQPGDARQSGYYRDYPPYR